MIRSRACVHVDWIVLSEWFEKPTRIRDGFFAIVFCCASNFAVTQTSLHAVQMSIAMLATICPINWTNIICYFDSDDVQHYVVFAIDPTC